MLLNAQDLFFRLIPHSITTSWCNASVNPCALTIGNNSALHAFCIIAECWMHETLYPVSSVVKVRQVHTYCLAPPLCVFEFTTKIVPWYSSVHHSSVIIMKHLNAGDNLSHTCVCVCVLNAWRRRCKMSKCYATHNILSHTSLNQKQSSSNRKTCTRLPTSSCMRTASFVSAVLNPTPTRHQDWFLRFSM